MGAQDVDFRRQHAQQQALQGAAGGEGQAGRQAGMRAGAKGRQASRRSAQTGRGACRAQDAQQGKQAHHLQPVRHTGTSAHRHTAMQHLWELLDREHIHKQRGALEPLHRQRRQHLAGAGGAAEGGARRDVAGWKRRAASCTTLLPSGGKGGEAAAAAAALMVATAADGSHRRSPRTRAVRHGRLPRPAPPCMQRARTDSVLRMLVARITTSGCSSQKSSASVK